MSVVNWTNVTDFAQIPGLANTASTNTFWIGMLHMIFIILLLVMIGYGFEVAITTAAFLSLIIAFFLVYSNLIAWGYIVEFAGILLFIFLYITWSSKRN